ncbi:tRNA epoxyqueuosine(34) reductase QueG [Stieleria sp. TO1_6]|uniref:tRNA epoxyqueuosine(34) reductase QueG n=1 Tax=Stieleria tagensis TaxID=2956795 RepID=UPI00209B7C29|nr:tRNA epoxyqueuosine(34) reductase QueG [Stieleria tagensis]MCO8120602.1 tRNA epoxyqueuosine(34) reductase QueG [Stieleria tagensis]
MVLHPTERSTHAAPWLQAFGQFAEQLGFVKWGIAPAIDASGFSDLVKWIDSGYAAEMDYFANRLDAYRHPRGVMAGTKSIVVMAYPYPADPPDDSATSAVKVARYAWPGADYHDTLHHKMKQLKRLIRDQSPTTNVRGCVDTAPLLERELAVLAGLGWRGKNTLLLNRQLGSYFFLCCLLLDVELPYDDPYQTSHCGTCTACLDACPTDAFPAPGVLDANRCISYLTIEHREAIPMDLQRSIGEWAFGCDICQEVCPWNRKPSRHSDTSDQDAPLRRVSLEWFFDADEDQFRQRFRKTPLWRTRLRGIQRNAAIVLGNQGQRASLPALRKGASSDDEIVAATCRWAIQQIEQTNPNV